VFTRVPPSATTIVLDLLASFNVGDWDRFRWLLAEDAVYEEPGLGRRVDGADGYLEIARDWRRAFPDLRGTVRQLVATGGSVAVEIGWRGTHSGPFLGPHGTVRATGRAISFDAVLWLSVDGGTVCHVRHHLDTLTLLVAVGAAETPVPSGW
jgi:steroid delta-isomerase-like uncharacterized protein